MDRRIKEAPISIASNRTAVATVGTIVLGGIAGLAVLLAMVSSVHAATLMAIDYGLLVLGGVIFLYSNRRSLRIASTVTLLLIHLGLLMYAAYFMPRSSVQLFSSTSMLAGFWLVSYGLRRRVGTDLRCIKCDYPHNDQPYCPECHADWTDWYTLVRGERIRDVPCITIGVTCLLLSFGLMVGPLSSQLLAKRVSTSMLIRMASTPGGSYVHFDELANRTLSAVERDTLASLLVDTRDRVGELDSAQEQWLHDATAGQSISPTNIDRYLSGLYSFRLTDVAPSHLGVPDGLDVIVNSNSRSDLAGREMHVWCEGAWSADTRITAPDASWQPLARLSGHELDDHRGWSLKVPFTPTTSGHQNIRVVYWLAWFPRATGPTRWPPRQVVVPPPTAIWSKRIELSTTIDVQP